MKDEDSKLSDAETWDGDHLSELALSCLADAQDVIGPVARVHAESCAACMLRVGAMALESHDVGAALAVAKQIQAKERGEVVHRFPTALVAAAAAIAIATGVPMLLDSLPRAIAWAFAAPHIVPVVTTSLVAVARSFSSAAVSLVVTFALALLGFAIALASRSRSQGVSS
jgi:hypothetical protein